MKKLLSLLISIPFVLTALACLNEHHVTKHGRESIDAFTLRGVSYFKTFDKKSLEEKLNNLLSEKPVTEDDILSTKNSIAVTYIKLGKLKEAEKILDELLKKYPNDYSIVINLGTLYELQGKNTKALEYIKKAIAINPSSHGESEWFHVKILEYKIKGIPDNKIMNESILDLQTINKPASYISDDISYQLQERIPFSPAPDMLIAKVMQEYGDFLADSISIKGAYVIYEIGMDYDRGNVLKLNEKRDALLPFFKKYKEAIPVTKNYYVDNIIQAVDDNKGNIITSVLDKGLNYFAEQDKQKREKEKQQKMIIVGSILALALLGLFFIIKKRRSNQAA